MPTPTDPLVTIDELATYLRVAPATIRGWRTNGRGPIPFKVAGSLRWRLSDVDAWLEASRQEVAR